MSSTVSQGETETDIPCLRLLSSSSWVRRLLFDMAYLGSIWEESSIHCLSDTVYSYGYDCSRGPKSGPAHYISGPGRVLRLRPVSMLSSRPRRPLSGLWLKGFTCSVLRDDLRACRYSVLGFNIVMATAVSWRFADWTIII